MNTKHTPGPWTYSEKEDIVHAVSGEIVAEMSMTTSSDARLIAAAPDLLSVCRRLERFLANHRYPELQGIADENAKAIAKAEDRHR